MSADANRLRRRCTEHGYFVASGEKCPEAPQMFWGGTKCEFYDPVDEILAAVQERRKDEAFMARLHASIERYRPILDALEASDGEP